MIDMLFWQSFVSLIMPEKKSKIQDVDKFCIRYKMKKNTKEEIQCFDNQHFIFI
jgi:hypothetical protein